MVAAKIKEAREAAGFTQASLAEALDKSEQAIYYWETAKREPRFSDVAKMADIFGLPSSWFFEGQAVGERVFTKKSTGLDKSWKQRRKVRDLVKKIRESMAELEGALEEL